MFRRMNEMIAQLQQSDQSVDVWPSSDVWTANFNISWLTWTTYGALSVNRNPTTVSRHLIFSGCSELIL